MTPAPAVDDRYILTPTLTTPTIPALRAALYITSTSRARAYRKCTHRQSMSQHVVRRLRPHLFTRYQRVHCSRAFSHAGFLRADGGDGRDVTHDYEKRVAQLEAQRPLAECYPRLIADHSSRKWTIIKALEAAAKLEPDKVSARRAPFVVAGMCSDAEYKITESNCLRQSAVGPHSRLQVDFHGLERR